VTRAEELAEERDSWKHAAEQLSKFHNNVVYERDKARADAEALAEALEGLSVVAATYFDTGRGDLDGQIERANRVLARYRGEK
jgi:hypothetical protein